MYVLTPSIAAEVTGGKYNGSDELRHIPIAGAVRDNRDVKPGNLFVCIQGERTDGHLYANSAYESGAACCLAEKEIPNAKGAYILVDSTLEAIKKLAAFHRSHFDIPIIGITGSVGKTTAKELIASALGSKLCVLKTEKNLNNELGVPLTLMSLNPEHEVAVIEMGISDFGEMSRLAQMVLPTIFVITCIGYSHTVELGNLNGVLRAKTEAFKFMSQDGIAILNGDDEFLRTYNPGMRRILFGLGENSDYRAENVITQGTESVTADIISNTTQLNVKIPAFGSHLAALAPAAACVGHLLGLQNNEIIQGLLSYSHVEGRSNVSNINGITLINDCYNANPNSVKSALVSLSKLSDRRVAILGDMLNLGTTSDELHYDVGRFAAKCNIDLLLCCGKSAKYIAEGFNDADGGQSQYYSNIEALMDKIPAIIKKSDAVLVKASRDLHFERLLPFISGLSQ